MSLLTLEACTGQEGGHTGASARFTEYDGVIAAPASTNAECAAPAHAQSVLSTTTLRTGYLLWSPESDAPCATRMIMIQGATTTASLPVGTRVRVVESNKLDYAGGASVTVATVRILQPLPNVPPMVAVLQEYVQRR